MREKKSICGARVKQTKSCAVGAGKNCLVKMASSVWPNSRVGGEEERKGGRRGVGLPAGVVWSKRGG